MVHTGARCKYRRDAHAEVLPISPDCRQADGIGLKYQGGGGGDGGNGGHLVVVHVSDAVADQLVHGCSTAGANGHGDHGGNEPNGAAADEEARRAVAGALRGPVVAYGHCPAGYANLIRRPSKADVGASGEHDRARSVGATGSALCVASPSLRVEGPVRNDGCWAGSARRRAGTTGTDRPCAGA